MRKATVWVIFVGITMLGVLSGLIAGADLWRWAGPLAGMSFTILGLIWRFAFSSTAIDDWFGCLLGLCAVDALGRKPSWQTAVLVAVTLGVAVFRRAPRSRVLSTVLLFLPALAALALVIHNR